LDTKALVLHDQGFFIPDSGSLLSEVRLDPMVEREPLGAAVSYSVDFARERIQGKSLAVLTGAGLSTDSGIPDYRGEGRVARHPMTFDVFVGSHEAQVRYWARSFVGWNRIAEAQPNAGHFALAHAENLGRVSQIITQNVDGLHQKAGSKSVIDLHGRLDLVTCLGCGFNMTRTDLDELLQALNPTINRSADFEFTPDGDAEVEAADGFQIPKCPRCEGVLKPDVVFFGESVPQQRAETAMAKLDAADSLLVAGTSLQVNSGLKFVRRAARAGKPIVIVNLGETKGDSLASIKIDANTSQVLERLLVE
jgi:NAD-dependent SIR2 family protein deacetylase